VYAAAGTLRAVGFDLDRLAVIGTSVPLPERVMMLVTDTAEFNIARDTGSLVYVERSTVAAARTLVWVDRLGHEEPVAEAGVRAYEYPRLSPDGTRVLVSISTQNLNDDNIWMWEVAQKTLRRVTSKLGINQVPLWMPGGRHFVFNAREGEGRSLFLQAADGTGAAEPLMQSQDPVLPSSVSPNGTRLLFSQQGAGSQADIMMLTLENRTVEPLTSTPFIERNGEISPDGQWLAYQENESGQFQIAVRPFPNVNAGIWHISEGGGSQPLWAADSRELFYRAPDGAIMSVRLERGRVWTTPAKLFDGPYYAGRGFTSDARTYDLARDKRFLLIKEDSGTGRPVAASSIRVILNWREELKRLAPLN
jgi:Tol biopolymer transport system component